MEVCHRMWGRSVHGILEHRQPTPGDGKAHRDEEPGGTDGGLEGENPEPGGRTQG